MAMVMETDFGGSDVGAHVRTRTLDSDTDSPPRNHPFKRVHHTNPPHAPGVSYRECMKNHAASIGGHALDGCCEFMPRPTFNPLDPTSLKCGACGCHRNFHRRDPDDPTPLNHHPTPARVPRSPPSASQLLLSLNSPSGPSDEVNPTAVIFGGQNGNFASSGSGSSRKRFRTKFTQEQKEKMLEFSDKIGWKLKKGDEKLIEEFVREIGVNRSVFKVWMHNNKHTSSSIPKPQDPKVKLDSCVIGVDSNNNNNNNNNYPKKPQQQPVCSNNVSSKCNPDNDNGNGNDNNMGNCGASVFDNHNHNHNHRQFNFGNGSSQEAAQAQ